MKKIFPLFALIQIFLIPAISQPCLPEGIIFTSQEQIDSFQVNYPGCTEIEGNMEISDYSIFNVDSLYIITAIGGDLIIFNNYNLTNLSGLDSLSYVGGDLKIDGCHSLMNFSGLNSISQIGNSLIVFSNNSQENFEGLGSLNSIGESIHLTYMEDLSDISALQGLTELPGDLNLGHVGLTDLYGLHNITSIGGHLDFCECFVENFDGLQSLLYIGGDLEINSSGSYTQNLSGLENLQIIGGEIELVANSFQSLDGLEGLHTVHGDVSIGFCFELINLNGLINLTEVGGGIGAGYCDALSDITGIQNVSPESLSSLGFHHNQQLSECDIESVCQFLAMPNADVSIYDNAPGCNSIEEVEEACLTEVEELEIDNFQFNVYPNPANNILNIEQSDQNITYSVELRNLFGQIVKEVKNIQSSHYTLNVTDLKAGVYFYMIREGDRIMQQGKLIKK